MEFYEVIEKRRSIREIQDKPIARNMLERILNAGLPPLVEPPAAMGVADPNR